MGVIKDLWTKIEKGEAVYEKARLPGKLPRGTRWVQHDKGWTLVRKTQDELNAEKAKSAIQSSGSSTKDDLKRLYLI
ncbi:MAG: hypothetical protein U1E27_10015, partial [Kiritimatiellia bacterium]|nr:hypothetical protein [Kiritimatiellia bacterium]